MRPIEQLPAMQQRAVRTGDRIRFFAEEILNWSVQVPLDHQLTFGELSEAMHQMRVAGVPADARVQLNGNQLMAWKRNQLG